MNPHDLIEACHARGISLKVRGNHLRCRAPVGIMTPALKQALADQKGAILEILAVEVPDTPPAMVADDREVIAVKVLSPILGEALWVVADDLPRDNWPTDASMYTHTEVKILQRFGPDTLAWVHATKALFNARIISATPDPQPTSQIPEQPEAE